MIPIEIGKCTYVLIEAEGYKDWEEGFCITDAKNYPVEILLVPLDDMNPLQQQG